jgi:hypothetical protein
MSIINTFKAFFKSLKDDPDLDTDPVAVASRERFSAANNAFSAASDIIKSYTIRANHRFAILSASSSRHPGSEAYNKAVADYTDPADFESYTEAYLDAHTAAMDTLAEAFDNLTIVFDTLKPADARYALAASLYKANCDIYVFAASAYTKAAHCAIDTALNGQFQSVIDNADLLVKGVIESTTPATNYEVLERKGPLSILDGRRYQYKGLRNGVAIDGSFSSYEYIQDALLRLQVGFDKKKIETGIVLLTSQRSEKSPLGSTKELVEQEIQLLQPTISLPVTIALFDLGKPGNYTQETKGNTNNDQTAESNPDPAGDHQSGKEPAPDVVQKAEKKRRRPIRSEEKEADTCQV